MMMNQECDCNFKVIVIGDSGVGKSSLTLRFSEDVFYKDHAQTIGVDFRMCRVNYSSMKVRLQLWDTAGQERFQSIATSFYRGANGALICFDLTNKASFYNLEHWVDRIVQYSVPGLPCVVVGCKLDDAQRARVVTKEEASQWAKQHSMPYLETSAKDKNQVSEAFETIVSLMIGESAAADDHRKDATGGKAPSVSMHENSSRGGKKPGCSC